MKKGLNISNRICLAHKDNFETLKRAFMENSVCLMDCIDKSTNEHVAVICAVNPEAEEFDFVPFAKFFNGNPYDQLIPPMEYEPQTSKE